MAWYSARRVQLVCPVLGDLRQFSSSRRLCGPRGHPNQMSGVSRVGVGRDGLREDLLNATGCARKSSREQDLERPAVKGHVEIAVNNCEDVATCNRERLQERPFPGLALRRSRGCGECRHLGDGLPRRKIKARLCRANSEDAIHSDQLWSSMFLKSLSTQAHLCVRCVAGFEPQTISFHDQ